MYSVTAAITNIIRPLNQLSEVFRFAKLANYPTMCKTVVQIVIKSIFDIFTWI